MWKYQCMYLQIHSTNNQLFQVNVCYYLNGTFRSDITHSISSNTSHYFSVIQHLWYTLHRHYSTTTLLQKTFGVEQNFNQQRFYTMIYTYTPPWQNYPLNHMSFHHTNIIIRSNIAGHHTPPDHHNCTETTSLYKIAKPYIQTTLTEHILRP